MNQQNNKKMKFTFTHTAELLQTGEWQELEFIVTAVYHPKSYGTRDSFGAPCEPDEDEEIEILEVVDIEGVEYNPEQIEGIYQAAWREFESL